MSKVTAGNVVELMVARYREDYEARGSMNVGEVALVLGVSVASVKRFTETGKLACARTVGGHRRFTPQQVADYLNATTGDAVLLNPNTPIPYRMGDKETPRGAPMSEDDVVESQL